MLLSDKLNSQAVQTGINAAVHYLGKDTVYSEFKSRIGRLSYLYQNTIGQGARVAFLASNSPAVITTIFALGNNRSVSILMDPKLPDDDIATWIRESDANYLAVTEDLVPRARELLRTQQLSMEIIEIEKKHGGEYDPVFVPPPDHVPLETDTVLILRTGGNQNKPRLVELNHQQLIIAATSLRNVYHSLGTDRMFTTLPWCHPFAFIHGVLFPLFTGQCVVIDHGAEGKDLLDFVIDAKVSRIADIPRFFTKLLRICMHEKQTLPRIRSITVGLGRLSPALYKAFELMKVKVCECYGMTENCWTIAMTDTHSENITPTSGMKGLPGFKYKVLDENLDEITTKGPRQGQLAVTAQTTMSGYYAKDPKEATQQTKQVIRGTWIYTGDYARIDDSRPDEIKIHLIGRKEELILREGGVVISPAEMDAHLKGLKGVVDAAGFCVTSAKGEKQIGCAIVPKPGIKLSEAQIKEACKSVLPIHLQPKFVVFPETIPKDLAGNVKRLALQRAFEGAAA